MLDKSSLTQIVWLSERPLYDAEVSFLERLLPGLPIVQIDTGEAELTIGSAMTLLHGCSPSWLPVVGARASILVVLATQGYRFAYLCECGTPPYDDELYYVCEREQTLVTAD